MQRARSVQMSMLPSVPVVDGLEIAASYRPCDLLGGDFYDFILIDAWRIGLVMADVSGHGAAAALLMAVGKKVIQMCGRGNLSPRQTLLEVNDSLRADIPSGMFLSALYGVIDIRNRRFCFASCGHNPPMMRRGDKVKNDWTHDNAPVLGVMPSSQLAEKLKEEFVQLEPGDVLLFHTDGITEAFNANKSMYGEARLGERVRTAANGAQALIDAIRADVDAFRGNAPLSDDETMMVIRVSPAVADPRALLKGAEQTGSSLPTFAHSLIGRDDEVASVASQVQSRDHAPITLTGPAGAGKSRVAVAAAEAVRDAFPGGIHYADLQRSATVGDVCRQVATTLRLGDDETRLGLRISMALQSPAGNSLLLLDNCETAREAVKRCADEWLERAPGLRLLATSRAPLEVKGERCVALKPMPVPREGKLPANAAEALVAYPSIRLFAQRAQAADSNFKLNHSNLNDVAQICIRLDGLPQAIELAAARATVLTPRQILDRLDKRFELLGDKAEGERGTLQGTLAMSWELLAEPEQRAAMLLSQFPAGFQLDVATPLLAVIPERSAEELVNALLKQSLLHSDVLSDLGGERRFHMYESVRAFGLDKLGASHMKDAARKLFEKSVLDYCKHWWRTEREKGSSFARRRVQHELQALLDLAQHTKHPETRAMASVIAAPLLHAKGEKDRAMTILRGAMEGIYPGSDEWNWVLIVDANLRVNEAPDHAEEILRKVDGDTDMKFAAMLTRATAFQGMGQGEDGIELIKQAGAMPGLTSTQQARLKDKLGVIFAAIGKPKEARNLFETAVRQARNQEDQLLLAQCLFDLGWANMRSEHAKESVKQLEEALSIGQREGDRAFESSALGGLALGLHLAGERQEAEACALRGIRLARELGRTHSEVAQLNTLTRIYHEQHRDKEAMEIALKARTLAQEAGSRKGEAFSEGNIASLKLSLGQDFEGAEEALRRSYELFLELGEMRSALTAISNLGTLLGERWRAHGKQSDLAGAIDNLTQAVNTRRELGYDPNVEAEYMLAKLLADSGRKKDARELLEKAFEVARERGYEMAKVTATKVEELLAELETAPLVGKRRERARPGSQAPLTPARPAQTVEAPPQRKPSSGRMAPAPKPASSGKLPMVQPPPQKGSSNKLPVVTTPPQKTSSGVILPVGRKPASSGLPPVKGKRPKGPPGQAPKRRPRGFGAT